MWDPQPVPFRSYQVFGDIQKVLERPDVARRDHALKFLFKGAQAVEQGSLLFLQRLVRHDIVDQKPGNDIQVLSFEFRQEVRLEDLFDPRDRQLRPFGDAQQGDPDILPLQPAERVQDAQGFAQENILQTVVEGGLPAQCRVESHESGPMLMEIFDRLDLLGDDQLAQLGHGLMNLEGPVFIRPYRIEAA